MSKTSHLKRLKAPKQWLIARKAQKYITRPKPGAHKYELALALNTVMIQLGLATTKKEVKYILKHGEIQVDGRKRHTEKQQVGLMDILHLPKSKKTYRMTMTAKGLEAVEIKDNTTKLVKITGKTQLKGGKTQLKTLDGRCIVVDKDTYKTGDSLVISLPDQKVKEHFKFEKGSPILLFRGAHQGAIATVEDFDSNVIKFKLDNKVYETKTSYAFVVGKDKSIL